MEKNTDLVIVLKNEHREKYRFDFSFEKESRREKNANLILVLKNMDKKLQI